VWSETNQTLNFTEKGGFMQSVDLLFDAIRERRIAAAIALYREMETEGVIIKDGLTPLLYCAYAGLHDVASALIDAGVHPDLFESVALGRLTEFFRNIRPDINLDDTSSDGWTALHLAAFGAQREMAEELIRRGATVQVLSENDLKNSPLHAAIAGANDPGFVKFLLSMGADPNAKDASGVTPLHLAASRGNEASIKVLLEAGAKETTDNSGKLPADYALERDHPEILGLFKETPQPAART
jgi:ankyrin repeat protein